MNIQTINNQEIWQTFVENLNLNTFLHSNQWAQFNQDQNTIWQYGLYDEHQELISVALVIKIEAKRGTFLLIPHGPQYDADKVNEIEVMNSWTKHFKELCKTENCSFFRVQPILIKAENSEKLFANLGYKPAPIHVHTELSSVLDITGDEHEILLNMRKTTRQMIKKGLKMVEDKELILGFPTEINAEMHQVYKDTYTRGGAVAYSEKYINKEWQVFGKNGKATLISITYQNKIISWGLMILHGKRAFYHQGGNILHKNIPNSYLLQWQGILFAKEKQAITYDFWGVSPLDKPNHPWANISMFKRGFGGQDVELLHAQDNIISPKYWINWIIEKLRAYKRGF